MRCVYVILAGGQARRMDGACKLLLPIADDKVILDYILSLIPPDAMAAGDIALNASEAILADGLLQRRLQAKDLQSQLTIISDDAEFAGCGPLAGMLAGLDYAVKQGADAVIILPSDTPFIPADLPASLISAYRTASDKEADKNTIISAYSCGQAHPVISLLPVEVRPALLEYLRVDKRKIAPFFQRHDWQYVTVAPFEYQAEQYDYLLNINDAAQLQQARSMESLFAREG